MSKSPESPSSPNKISRRRKIIAAATAALALSGITGTAVAVSGSGHSKESAQPTPTALEVPASTSSTLRETSTTLRKVTTTTRPATTTTAPTTTTTEAPTTTTEAPTTTSTTTPETPSNPEVMPNPFKGLELDGPVKFQNYEIASFQLLKDQAPRYFAPIQQYLDEYGMKLVYVADGQGRNIEPTTSPVATINVERIQLDSGVLELAAGNDHEFKHARFFANAFSDYKKTHPNANKQQAGMDPQFNEHWRGIKAEDACLTEQADVQRILGDTQANIDYTLSHLSTAHHQPVGDGGSVH